MDKIEELSKHNFPRTIYNAISSTKDETPINNMKQIHNKKYYRARKELEPTMCQILLTNSNLLMNRISLASGISPHLTDDNCESLNHVIKQLINYVQTSASPYSSKNTNNPCQNIIYRYRKILL